MKNRYLLLFGVFNFFALSAATMPDESFSEDIIDEMSCEQPAVKANSFLQDGTYHQDERLAESEPMVNDERHIVVMTCSYNNENYCQWNLDSVFSQQYSNYSLIYVDDCSSDTTLEQVKEYIVENDISDRVILFHNEKRRKALANLYYAINTCKPTDIIILLDGDDRFAHTHVLERINQAYSDPNIWLTYGQFMEHKTGVLGFCRPYPQGIVDLMSFRYHPPTPSHLRTFYAGLFHKIRKDDLMFRGDFFPTTYDLAIMFPMIEMARYHFKFIPDVLLEYNGDNPINDHKGINGKGLQRKFDLLIRARTCYPEIDNPF